MNTAKVNFFIPFFLFLLLTGCKEEPKPSVDKLPQTGNPVIDQLSKKISQTPNDKTLFFERAKVYYDNIQYAEAIQDLKKVLSLDSLDIGALHLLSDAYMDHLESKKALLTMEHAAKLYPKRIPTLLKLSEVYYILMKYDDSMRIIDQILRIDPQNAEAYFMFGQNFKDLGDSIRAINSYQKAVDFDPDLIDGWINLGQQYAKINPKIAEKYFKTATEIDPGNVLAIHAMADFLRNQNRLNEAIALYKKTVVIDPQYEEGSYNAGLLYLELDSIPQAIKMFDICIEVAPIFIPAYFYRGYAYELLGDKKRAKSNYEQALNMAPDYKEAKEGLARVVQ